MPYSTLEVVVAVSLRRAVLEKRFDVAEHLLRALEALEISVRSGPQSTGAGSELHS